MIKKTGIILGLICLFCPWQTAAHEIRPALLQLQQVAETHYQVLWKKPTRAGQVLKLQPTFPIDCETSDNTSISEVKGALIERWRIDCQQLLSGRDVSIANLDIGLSDVIFVYQPQSGPSITTLINAQHPISKIPNGTAKNIGISAYFTLGVEHILEGYDHLLFVICLVLLITSVKWLCYAITTFTIAHSITLAAATFNLVQLSLAPIEACIALSIVYLAFELLKQKRESTSTTGAWLLATCFGFGLLHGFGFASALSEIGLPEQSIFTALFLFNLGVESGQLAIMLLALIAKLAYQSLLPTCDKQLNTPIAYAAGGIACFWFIERTLQIL